jgi:hypothetical protein
MDPRQIGANDYSAGRGGYHTGKSTLNGIAIKSSIKQLRKYGTRQMQCKILAKPQRTSEKGGESIAVSGHSERVSNWK